MRFAINFIRMRDQDGEGLERQSIEGAFQVVGLKVMAVVDADDPEALPVPPYRTRVVYQEGNALVLQ